MSFCHIFVTFLIFFSISKKSKSSKMCKIANFHQFSHILLVVTLTPKRAVLGPALKANTGWWRILRAWLSLDLEIWNFSIFHGAEVADQNGPKTVQRGISGARRTAGLGGPDEVIEGPKSFTVGPQWFFDSYLCKHWGVLWTFRFFDPKMAPKPAKSKQSKCTAFGVTEPWNG